ncbi:hypothetical protein ANO11243_036760 [Dothideomycetidae sp. 11243]|nr:hypothetical protein ANO11243_036760 [fungal sp. No.11243]
MERGPEIGRQLQGPPSAGIPVASNAAVPFAAHSGLLNCQVIRDKRPRLPLLLSEEGLTMVRGATSSGLLWARVARQDHTPGYAANHRSDRRLLSPNANARRRSDAERQESKDHSYGHLVRLFSSPTQITMEPKRVPEPPEKDQHQQPWPGSRHLVQPSIVFFNMVLCREKNFNSLGLQRRARLPAWPNRARDDTTTEATGMAWLWAQRRTAYLAA